MTDPQAPNLFWKRKLAAFLHDPPSKFADIGNHEEQAKTLFRQAGFVDENETSSISELFAKSSDWIASAADRFPFPKSRGRIRSAFDGVQSRFNHPFSPGNPFTFHEAFLTAETAIEKPSALQPVISELEGWSEEDLWKARFFCHWRLWEKFCVEQDYRYAFLPADTRIPDHTIWAHMQVVSALNGCSDGHGPDAQLKPAFLKFQLGPVQDFIAEARSVRDLWSGSYLLSWLMAAGLKALALEVGPDCVIYPNLKDQPIFDLHLKYSFWSQIKVNGKSVWEHLGHQNDALLTPNLPNVFLAVVHRDHAERLGRLVEKAIRDEWKRIAQAVWQYCENAGMLSGGFEGLSPEGHRERFNRQVERFLSLSWQATPWPETLETALSLADAFDQEMPIQTASKRVKTIVDFATRIMPQQDRDGRYYVGGENGPKTELNNIGLGWSVILALNGWQLDALRQTRAFQAWGAGGWETGVNAHKDSLGGKAEAVAGGARWQSEAEKKGGVWRTLFKHADWLGASTLIKRLWHLAYLQDWGLKTSASEFPMPNTHMIASHRPFGSGDDEDIERTLGEKYFAVLALDGDEIGKWVSGEKTPCFETQFSSYRDKSEAQEEGTLRYFKENCGEALLKTPRALSPSYHLEFSRALSHFALHCTRAIVEAHNGRLIYAGGDDVLAMLPADTALECAEALRMAFQGNKDLAERLKETANRLIQKGKKSKQENYLSKFLFKAVEGDLFYPTSPGYLSVARENKKSGSVCHPVPFIVPGSSAEVSVGIAIAHFKSPLQDVVRAAQKAEKQAKSRYGRSAVAITLMKRSGEIVEWGAKWNSGALALYKAIATALEENELSARFPYRVMQLLEPYLSPRGVTDARDFDAREIILREVLFAISRQAQPGKEQLVRKSIQQRLEDYLTRLAQDGAPNSTQRMLQALLGLCATVAFAHRSRGSDSDSPNQPSAAV